MGSGSSTHHSGSAHTKEVKEKYQIRLLSLGVQQSGKSTWAKQMKILFCRVSKTDEAWCSAEEMARFQQLLIENMIFACKELIDYTRADLPKSKKLDRVIKYFEEVNPFEITLTDEVIEKVETLYNQPDINKASCDVSHPFEYVATLNYMMKQGLRRYSDTTIPPTNEDILRIRQRTTGINETKFMMERYQFTIIDVGGQKVERRKWVHTQNSLRAILFFASLVDYDIYDDESHSDVSRMEESIQVFWEAVNGPAVRDLPVILLFTKKDLLQEKLKKSPLKAVYKKYRGGDDVEKAQQFIKHQYLDRNPDQSLVYSPDRFTTHYACVLDSSLVRRIFDSIRNDVLKRRFQESGL